MTAQRVEDAETDQIMDGGSAIYPGYPKYRSRANSHREIKVYLLELAG